MYRPDYERSLRRLRDMKAERGMWENMWREISRYILPRRQPESERSQGQNLMAQIFDATAIIACNRLAAVMQSILTNMSSNWFATQVNDSTIMEDDRTLNWLEANEEISMKLMQDSTLSQSCDELYLDTIAMGTGIMFIERGKQKLLHFETIPIYECYISENSEGIVDTLYREYKMTAWQIRQKFEGNLPAMVEEKLSNGELDHKFEILHVIEPRPITGKTPASAKEYPWASVYFLKDSKEVIFEGGYKTFPAVCPRWRKASGEVYGRGPGHEALADAKTLNEIVLNNLQACGRTINPPLDVEEDSYIDDINLSPNAINIRQRGSTPAKPLYMTQGLAVSLEREQAYQQRINEAFFYNQLQLVQNDRMTTTEVLQRTEENMRILGPTFGRFQSEFLEPLIKRVYQILFDAGALYPPPEPVQAAGLSIEYRSPLARAQRSLELMSIEHSILVAAPVIQIRPEVMDVIKWDDITRDLFVLNGVPRKRLNSEKEVEEVRQARAQQQAIASAIQGAEQMARAAKQASEADPTQGLLGQVFGGA